MTTTQRTGTQDEDDDRVLKDGERLVVPLQFADARPLIFDAHGRTALHAPGPRYAAPPPALAADAAASEARDRAYADYDRAISDAWKQPTAAATATKQTNTGDGRADVYEQHETWLRDAWRGAA